MGKLNELYIKLKTNGTKNIYIDDSTARNYNVDNKTRKYDLTQRLPQSDCITNKYW